MNHEPIERESMVFAGSAKATASMKQYAKRAVLRAIELDRIIIFGDSPSGVDMMCLITCVEAKYKHYSVVRMKGEKSRSIQEMHGRFSESQYSFEVYHDRDLEVIRLVDHAMFIWDGKGIGVRNKFEYACEQGVNAFLIDFKTGQPVLSKSQENVKKTA